MQTSIKNGANQPLLIHVKASSEKWNYLVCMGILKLNVYKYLKNG
jgi:hypothetical protein